MLSLSALLSDCMEEYASRYLRIPHNKQYSINNYYKKKDTAFIIKKSFGQYGYGPLIKPVCSESKMFTI